MRGRGTAGLRGCGIAGLWESGRDRGYLGAAHSTVAIANVDPPTARIREPVSDRRGLVGRRGTTRLEPAVGDHGVLRSRGGPEGRTESSVPVHDHGLGHLALGSELTAGNHEQLAA